MVEGGLSNKVLVLAQQFIREKISKTVVKK